MLRGREHDSYAFHEAVGLGCSHQSHRPRPQIFASNTFSSRATTALMSPNLATVIVGISGVSSSGKTTLARLLRDIFPGSFILHEDDFYWPDEKIPVRKGNQDWDCLESLDLQRFYNTLDFIKRSGSIPSDLDSKEDQNSAGASNVDPNVVEELKLRTAKYRYRLNLVIVEGFLLYAQPMQHIWSLLDTRLFLRTRSATALRSDGNQ